MASFDASALFAHFAGFGIVPDGRAEMNVGAEGDDLSLYVKDPDGNTLEPKGPAGGG